MVTKVKAAMVDADVATQAELDAVNTALDTRIATLEGPVTGKLVGDAVQAVYTEISALATGTTVIPADDTIPQNTEGDEYFTAAITPKSATNLLRIDVTVFLSNSFAGSNFITAALFQDAAADAIAAGAEVMSAANQTLCIHFTHWMVAGTTSATTFKVRAGGNSAGTTTFNGNGGTRLFGGRCASSITITEYKA